MSTALYRRYRPETFADVIGQEHVTEPLMQALKSGRVNHAYLFSGPRGCGKTTSARILARCLNCDQGPTAQPCGECESCVALARGGSGSIDVIEIDAASHGGVDDARDLRERAAFGPAQARYKVYIIDEAHMVTSHGFNALLKVVEEPPEHVKFIFATTEPEKVLATIRSRTHHYPFHLVPPQRLTSYLEELSHTEGVSLEPGVLSFVTRAGGGSVRDSLSVLDQLISGAGDEGLTYDRTAALLGFTDAELLDAVVDAVAAHDSATTFAQVDRVMESGHDPRRFIEDLLERYRDLIILQAVGDKAGGLLPGLAADQIERMRLQANSYGPSSLTHSADVVSRGLAEMTGAVSYRLILELTCARLLLPTAAGEQGYAARLDRIERRLSASDSAIAAPANGSAANRSAATPAGADRAGANRAAATPTGAPASVGTSAETRHTERPRADDEPAPATRSRGANGQGAKSQAANGQGPSGTAAQSEPPSSQTPAGPSSGPGQINQAGHLDTNAVRRQWSEVLDAVKNIRRVTWSFVSVNTTIVDFDGHRLLLEIATKGMAETFRRGNHAEVVRQALIDALALDVKVEAMVAGDPAPSGSKPAGGSEPPSGSKPTGGAPADGAAVGRASQRRRPDHEPPVMEEPYSDEPPMDEVPYQPPADWNATASKPAPSWAGGADTASESSTQAPSTQEFSTQEPSTQQPSARKPAPRSAEPLPPPAPKLAGSKVRGADLRKAQNPTTDEPSKPQIKSRKPPEKPRPAPGSDVPRDDDENLDTSSTYGQPVIESVLGGTVIAIDDDSVI